MFIDTGDFSGSYSLRIRHSNVNWLLFYSIVYGQKITNNFLKTHNGVMVRKRAYRKINRKKENNHGRKNRRQSDHSK